MTNSDRTHRGTVIPLATNDDIPSSTTSNSVCSASECGFGEVDNERSLDTKRNNEDATNVGEVESSSTAANEEDIYKMRSNIPQKNFKPAKIEFKRIKDKHRKCLFLLTPRKPVSARSNAGIDQRRSATKIVRTPPKQISERQNDTFLSRLKRSFAKMHQTSILIEAESSQTPRRSDPEKIDIYYFDHGNAAYFRTTDSPPTIVSEVLAQQTTHYATRFWAEIFGSLHIGVTFFITFFLQAYRFILYSFIRAIIVGIFQMTSDYLLKPILTVVFNGLIQPLLILIYNILSSVKDMLEPIAESIYSFVKPIAIIIKSFRLISISTKRIDYKNNVEDKC